jgi:S-DNA-T family DNA segregation ATPase FtsK/SpoIIIE
MRTWGAMAILHAVGLSCAGATVDGRWWPSGTPFAATGAASGTELRPQAAPRPAAPDPIVAELVVLEGPDAGHRVALPERSVMIGRSGTGTDLRLCDQRCLRHARIGVAPPAATVDDLGSTNGTAAAGPGQLCTSPRVRRVGVAAARGAHHHPPRAGDGPPNRSDARPPDRTRTPAPRRVRWRSRRHRVSPRSAFFVAAIADVLLASVVGSIRSWRRATGVPSARRGARTGGRRDRHRSDEEACRVGSARARRPPAPTRSSGRRAGTNSRSVLSVVAWSLPTTKPPDDAARAVLAAIATLRAVPIIVQGRGLVGVCGHREFAAAIARSLVAQVATLHGPADVQLVVLASASHAGEWAWTRGCHTRRPCRRATPPARRRHNGITGRCRGSHRDDGEDAGAPVVVDGDDDSCATPAWCSHCCRRSRPWSPPRARRGVVIVDHPPHLPASPRRRQATTTASTVRPQAGAAPATAALVGLGLRSPRP